jgi:hypothetical protein
MTPLVQPLRHARLVSALLALALLAMTLRWHVPMMLWDHLDLLPMLEAVQAGRLGAEFWQLHGGHWHSAAYALLLLTTSLSGGIPWIDGVISWGLLLAYAGVIGRLIDDARRHGRQSTSPWWLLVVGLALYPGHLANLQWGWQVAVFLCLLGVALSVLLLSRNTLGWRHNLGAIAAAVLALASFATAIALIPTALTMIAMRAELPLARRLTLAAPWLLLGLAIALYYRSLALHAPSVEVGAGVVLHYSLNFLGAGIARFATDLAPALALLALLLVLWLAPLVRNDRLCLPWLGLLLFAGFAALAVALGRAGSFGAEHAFVTRYVSFSSLFWLGLVGLLLTARRAAPARWPTIALGAVLMFGAFNALHMISKAAKLAASTRETAEQIRTSYPDVDETLLQAIYFDQADVARERLQLLHRWGYPPFSADEAVTPH